MLDRLIIILDDISCWLLWFSI